MPLSYLHVKFVHQPSFPCWYRKFVDCSNAWSWSMRNTSKTRGELNRMPPFSGPKKRARVCPSAVYALNPWIGVRLTRMAKPSIFDLRHSIGNSIGELKRVSKSKAFRVNFQK